MSNSLVLTVDLGTSGPKVSVFNEKVELIDSEFSPTKLVYTSDGGVEQDPADWLNAIFRAYETIAARGKFNPKDIDIFNITAQWSGTVALGENGMPLMNCIIWMDDRGAPYAGKLTDGLIKVDGYDIFKIFKWISITGGAPTKSGKDSIAHILFLKNKKQEVYEKAKYFLEPKDYLNYYFTGRVATSVDGATLHWITDIRDINNVRYHDGLIKQTGIDKSKLPELLPANCILGEMKRDIADKMGLGANVKVVSGSPDTHSAAIGSGAVKDYEAHVYVGTSGWLLTHLPFKKTDLLHNMTTIPSSIPGRYLVINEQESSGNCLNFLKNNLLYAKDEISQTSVPTNFYELLDKEVEKVPAGSNGVMFTPWLNGERSPIDDHKTRASFLNLGLKSTRGDMVRAVYEGVANNNRWLMMYVEKLMGRQIEGLRFIGGGANSNIWCQIMADTMNREILQIEDPIAANSRGAAMLALAAVGKIDIDDMGKYVKVRNSFKPNTQHRQLYDERFEIYKTIYNKQKSIFSRLNA
ncbi:MAG: FGGY-family carbohydrate kinase [Chitinophagales bacterium]|nr:FGGY-family carbohydrate kinase [Chitinophagales bacterium]